MIPTWAFNDSLSLACSWDKSGIDFWMPVSLVRADLDGVWLPLDSPLWPWRHFNV